jgi:hypothetical protein
MTQAILVGDEAIARILAIHLGMSVARVHSADRKYRIKSKAKNPSGSVDRAT